jgi:beta-1,4-mannosyltransferase
VTNPLRVLGWPAFRNRSHQPYTALLYEHMPADVAEATTARVASGRYDILHVHWPDRRVRDTNVIRAVTRSAGLISLLDLAHARGLKVVWTVHNLSAHEGSQRPWLETRYWHAFTRRVDAFIAMSPSGITAARERYPQLVEKRAFLIPHPHYRGVYPDTIGRVDARSRLGVQPAARVIAFVGQVREYKNVPRMIDAFRSLEDRNALLLVAGKPRNAEHRTLVEAAALGDARVLLDLRFIPDDEIQIVLRAADLVVLPYREILNSGSALLALSFDRPVLVPDRGAMADLQRVAGDDWVRTYHGELTAATLQGALEWSTMAGRPRAPDLDGLGWTDIAQQTTDAFRALRGNVDSLNVLHGPFPE